MVSGMVSAEGVYRLYIDGEWVESGKTFAVTAPATEETLAVVAEAGAAEVDLAVRAARRAFDGGPWADSTPNSRAQVLFKLAAKVRAELAALAEVEATNTGKPIVEAEGDIGAVAEVFEYYAGLATKIPGLVNPVSANALSLSLKEPIGVAGLIVPWNYPLLMAAWKLAPALAAGCTCVLKPAEQTPLTALMLARWFEEAGLPPGVVNVVNGFGESCGAPIVDHPLVDKIAFTGSTEVGKAIVKRAADTLKRVTLELGGSRRISFSRTRIGRRRWLGRCLGSSSIRVRCARRAAGSWWSGRFIRILWRRLRLRRRRSSWARRWTGRRGWAR